MKLQATLLALYSASAVLCTQETVDSLYGLPVLGDAKNPYHGLINYPGFEDLRTSKSLLNTFPFNQAELSLTESLSSEPQNSKQTAIRGVARTVPTATKNKLTLPQYSFLRQEEGEDTTFEPATEGPGEGLPEEVVDTTTVGPDTTHNPEDADSTATEDPHQDFGKYPEGDNYYGSSALNSLASLQPDKLGKKCVNKVMMVEETIWDDVEICDHSYDRRCHTSYTTTFEAQQQQECEENYRKNCFINYEKIAFNQTVQICRNPLVKDCSKTGESICRTEYESECQTKQEEYEVEDDVVDCQEKQEEKCTDVVFGYTTQTKCQKFPRNECNVKKQKVKKYSPLTNCRKVPIELCAPAGCGYKQGTEVCYDKVQTIVQDKPSEECNIEPQRVCKHVTKLVPRLMPHEECVDVPKEICSRARRNPRKVQKPMIKQWCYVPSQEAGLA